MRIKYNECLFLVFFLDRLIGVFHYDKPNLITIHNRLQDLKRIIEQDKANIAIKIFINCWDKEIDFDIVKAEAIKKHMLEKMNLTKIGIRFNFFFK